jgi:hypothetical protein
MNESISENTLRRRRSILTVLAICKQFELSRLINILNLVHNLSHEEVVRELRFMESEGLVRISGDTVALTSKGVEVVKGVGVDENLAKNIIEQLLVVTKPFLVTPALLKPRVGRLDVGLLDVEALKKTIYVFTPPKLSIHYPRVEKLDTSTPPHEDLSKLIALAHPMQIVLSRSKPKLAELDRNVVEKLVSVVIKPLLIKLQSVKLTSLDKGSEVESMSRIIAVKPLLLAIPKPVRVALDSQEPAVKHEVAVSEIQKGEESVDVDEVADILELFEFKEFGELRPSFGLATAFLDRPLIIIAIKPKNYDYVDILRYILRTIYRIVAGGLPQGEYFTVSGREEDREYREVELSRLFSESSRQGIIKVVEINEDIKANIFNVLEMLRNRLRELLVGGLSYTVLYVDESVSNDVIRFVLRHGDEFGADIVVLEPKKLSWEQMFKISALLWGFKEMAKLEKDSGEIVILQHQLNTFNKLFVSFADKYINELRRVYLEASRKGYIFIVKPQKVEGAVESPEHYLLKVFTTYYFVEREKVNLDDIRVEEPLPGCGGIVPDVFIASRGIAVEVETLYGEGLAWLNKLVQSVEKYRGCGVSEMWLVIPPLQASIFMKSLMSFAKWLNERRPINAAVKILTVDLEAKEFVPVAEIGKLIRRVLRRESIREEPAKS